MCTVCEIFYGDFACLLFVRGGSGMARNVTFVCKRMVL